jgi:cell division septum initiation protein DivIVA
MSDFSSDLPQEPGGVPPDLDVDTLVRRSLEIVNTAKTMPLSASVLVSRDELSELLSAALERLPQEIRQARWLLKERDEFLAERRREADALMEEVKVQAERMVSRAEIVRQANQVAQRILDDANEDARRMRHEVEDYCDQRLAGMEIVLDRLMRTVKSGREKLQATSLTATEAVGTAGAAPTSEEESSEDGFFDQDRA